jgi:phosphoenolpyruvate-protein kinase (PTS system EI component)
MPNITITVSTTLAQRLAVLKDKYSMEIGRELTVQEFILAVLKDAAIRQQLETTQETRRIEAAAAMEATIEADKQALLDSMA